MSLELEAADKFPMVYWTPEKIRRLSIFTVLLSILLLPVIRFTVKTSPHAVIALGDFAAFYPAATIVQEGNAPRLYDWPLQQEVQKRSTGDEKFSPFAYPPYTAFFLRPFALLPAAWAKTLFSLLMLACLAGSAAAAARHMPVFRSHGWETAAFFIYFAPVFLSVVGGQNAALGMLCYSLSLWFLSWNSKRGDLYCGLSLGLWLFKPHYPILIMLPLIASRSWRILTGFSIAALFYYFLGIPVLGWDWPLEWLDAAWFFSAKDLEANASYMISLTGFLASFSFHQREFLGFFAKTAACGSAALLLWLMVKGFKTGKIENPALRRAQLQKLLCLAGPAALLISPHTLFYDIGICIYACAPFIRLNDDKTVTRLVLLLLFVAAATALRQWLAFQPLFFVAAGSLFWINHSKTK